MKAGLCKLTSTCLPFHSGKKLFFLNVSRRHCCVVGVKKTKKQSTVQVQGSCTAWPLWVVFYQPLSRMVWFPKTCKKKIFLRDRTCWFRLSKPHPLVLTEPYPQGNPPSLFLALLRDWPGKWAHFIWHINTHTATIWNLQTPETIPPPAILHLPQADNEVSYRAVLAISLSSPPPLQRRTSGFHKHIHVITKGKDWGGGWGVEREGLGEEGEGCVLIKGMSGPGAEVLLSSY